MMKQLCESLSFSLSPVSTYLQVAHMCSAALIVPYIVDVIHTVGARCDQNNNV